MPNNTRRQIYIHVSDNPITLGDNDSLRDSDIHVVGTTYGRFIFKEPLRSAIVARGNNITITNNALFGHFSPTPAITIGERIRIRYLNRYKSFFNRMLEGVQ
jgi:hypothetical protein